VKQYFAQLKVNIPSDAVVPNYLKNFYVGDLLILPPAPLI